MVNKTVFLLSGKAGTGKTTSAVYMVDYLQGAKSYVGIYPFARAVKEIAYAMSWDGRKDERGRKLLQLIGNGGREYDPDVWVSQTTERISLSDNDVAIIDDWRYPNEYDYIKNSGGFDVIRVRIYAPSREILKGTPAYDDISENSLSDNPDDYDYFIENEGDFNALYAQLRGIMKLELGLG